MAQLATSLPLSSYSVTTQAVATVNAVLPNIVKDSNASSNSFSVPVAIGYRLGSNLNASIVPDVVNVANTKTVLPTIESIFDIEATGNRYTTTTVNIDVRYNVGQFTPNNYIIPIFIESQVANTKTVLPTVEWLHNIGAPEGSNYSNTTVVTNSAYTLGLANNAKISTSIDFVANTTATINALAIQGQALASVTVPTFSSDVTSFYIKPYFPTTDQLIKTNTINNLSEKPFRIKTELTVITENLVRYGASTVSNNAPGLTYVPAYTRTINDFPEEPYRAKGETSSVTFKFFPMATILSQSKDYYWREGFEGLRVNVQEYANSIFLIKSGSASSVTNFYATGGGFDPNSPYLGASTAYWS